MTTYCGQGIRFQYPEDWGIQEQSQGEEHLITVSSPATTFWSLGLFYGAPTPEHVVQTVLRALEDDYPEMDVYESRETLLERQTVARDVEFVCLELLNSARIRAFQTEQFTVLIMSQSTDDEFEEMEPVLDAITQSLECDIDPLEGTGRYLPEEIIGREGTDDRDSPNDDDC